MLAVGAWIYRQQKKRSIGSIKVVFVPVFTEARSHCVLPLFVGCVRVYARDSIRAITAVMYRVWMLSSSKNESFVISNRCSLVRWSLHAFHLISSPPHPKRRARCAIANPTHAMMTTFMHSFIHYTWWKTENRISSPCALGRAPPAPGGRCWRGHPTHSL